MSDISDLQSYVQVIHDLIRGLPERVVDLSLRTVTKEQLDLLEKFNDQIGHLNAARDQINVLMAQLNTIAEERKELRSTLFSGLAAIRAEVAKLSAGQSLIRADIDALKEQTVPGYSADDRLSLIRRFEQLELRLRVVLPEQEPAP
jgi:chromosome segregation ATPase